MQQMLEFLKASLREFLPMPKQINAYHDPFTHKFPPEISSMIFKHTMPDLWETQQRDQWVSSSQRSAPLTLSAVSQRWRTISQGTPKLWTDVHLNISLLYKIHYSSGSPISEHNQVKLEIFRQWLSRAGIHPLSLHITMLPKYTEKLNAGGFARQIRREEIDREFGPFIEVINSHAHRWQNLSVRSVDAVLLSLGRSYEDAPRLRTLMLSSLDGRQGSDTEEYVADDSADRFSLTTGTPRPSKNIRMRACIKTLSFAPQVVECRINHFFCSPRLITPEPIAHLSLKHLYVHDSALQGLNFMDEITLPALTHLSLRLGPLQLSDCHVLVDFVKRSSCILTNFELSSYGFGKEHMDLLIYLLCCLPSIEYLVLRRMDFHPEDLLRLLAITAVIVNSDTASSDMVSDNDNEKEERPSFLPKLQHFSYSLSIAQLQKETPWHLLPNVFGPLSGNNRRPLKSLKVDNEWRLDDDAQIFLENAEEIDEDVVRRLIDVVDAGFSLQLPVEMRKEDLMSILGRLDIQ
ncbi:hypothetical protein CVT25_004509 [Psilocybe cyanescens]|uniref:F-box domain-containing protein n=1 Tax=Psilocybe cyanescens TaxID=93625 RepID=A0A409XRJ9_PSICY|nr:hypothetical protein CVT25_004509 [Psilocybe cyanescens]